MANAPAAITPESARLAAAEAREPLGGGGGEGVMEGVGDSVSGTGM